MRIIQSSSTGPSYYPSPSWLTLTMTRPRQSSSITKRRRKSRSKKVVSTSKRAHHSPQTVASTLPNTRNTRKANLLSLPDEPLIQIITQLSKQTPSLTALPAFSLAQTNTRFLGIFSSLLTRITPYTSNPTPSTLKGPHLAAVARIAGVHLRAIHLPEGALWPELADHCPKVSELLFHDDWHSAKTARYLFQRLPLKTLKVVRPCAQTLSQIKMPLDKLVLENVCVSNIDPLLKILRRPPKELVLQLDDLGYRRMKRIMNTLRNAMPRMEKVSITTPSTNPPFQFHDDVRIMVKRLRDNGREGKCKTVSLSGPETFRFLRYVDSSASVTLSQGDVVYRCNPGENCRITKLPLQDHFPRVDITHLEELTICAPPAPEWLQRLPKLKHVEVKCQGLLPRVVADVATVPIPVVPYEEWNLPTKELRFVPRHLTGSEVFGFCETIEHIFRNFTGNVVWMEFVRGYDIPRDRDSLRWCVRTARYCCQCFEENGGDASSVSAWLDDVFARCF